MLQQREECRVIEGGGGEPFLNSFLDKKSLQCSALQSIGLQKGLCVFHSIVEMQDQGGFRALGSSFFAVEVSTRYQTEVNVAFQSKTLGHHLLSFS